MYFLFEDSKEISIFAYNQLNFFRTEKISLDLKNFIKEKPKNPKEFYITNI